MAKRSRDLVSAMGLVFLNPPKKKIKKKSLIPHDEVEPSKSGQKKSSFKFASLGICIGEELTFTEAPITVKVADEKNKIIYQGKPYSLSGFVKAFHPHPSKSGAYQGPKFFTYKGKVLNDLRSAASAVHTPENTASAGAAKVGAECQTSCACFKNVSQLAKYIAQQGGNEGAAGGIGQILTARRSCRPDSKWRKPFEDLGIKFNAQDFVIDWTCAKKEV